ncbi:MAG: lipid-A-disaccharide synthase, partial [Candidatus Omnitrophota bacterium]
MAKTIFILAGEASGDNHGAHLVRELKALHPDLEFTGLGGPRMASAGVRLLHDMTRLSVLGLGDVLRKYFEYRKIFYSALDEARRLKPDAVILIDSPAFNLRFAKKIRRAFPVFYYISPQIWAWGGRRIHTIRRTVSRMLVILPFEEELYRKGRVPCTFVGHPLLDQVRPSKPREALRRELGLEASERAIGLLSGSRETEVLRILPPMLETARRMRALCREAVFYVSLAPNVNPGVYAKILKPYADLPLRTPPPG